MLAGIIPATSPDTTFVKPANNLSNGDTSASTIERIFLALSQPAIKSATANTIAKTTVALLATLTRVSTDSIPSFLQTLSAISFPTDLSFPANAFLLIPIFLARGDNFLTILLLPNSFSRTSLINPDIFVMSFPFLEASPLAAALAPASRVSFTPFSAASSTTSSATSFVAVSATSLATSASFLLKIPLIFLPIPPLALASAFAGLAAAQSFSPSAAGASIVLNTPCPTLNTLPRTGM